MTRNKSETKIAIGTEDGYVVLYEIQIDGVLFEKSFNKQDSEYNLNDNHLKIKLFLLNHSSYTFNCLA